MNKFLVLLGCLIFSQSRVGFADEKSACERHAARVATAVLAYVHDSSDVSPLLAAMFKFNAAINRRYVDKRQAFSDCVNKRAFELAAADHARFSETQVERAQADLDRLYREASFATWTHAGAKVALLEPKQRLKAIAAYGLMIPATLSALVGISAGADSVGLALAGVGGAAALGLLATFSGHHFRQGSVAHIESIGFVARNCENIFAGLPMPELPAVRPALDVGFVPVR